MTHGTQLGIADNDERYGAEGAFLIEAGISSSYHIANFFGLTERLRSAKETAKETATKAAKKVSAEASMQPVKKIPASSALPARAPDVAAVLRPLTIVNREPPHLSRGSRIDVGSVITRA